MFQRKMKTINGERLIIFQGKLGNTYFNYLNHLKSKTKCLITIDKILKG